MTTTQDATRDTKARRNKRTERLSPDGKWRSFPKVPNLLQYVSTRLYFARVKVNGKLIRQSLGTDEFETAKLKLHDFILKESKKRRAAGALIFFRDARLSYELALANDHTCGRPAAMHQAAARQLAATGRSEAGHDQTRGLQSVVKPSFG